MYLIAGNHHLWIESRSRPGEMHSCHLDDDSGEWVCSCMGSVVHGHCWHLDFCDALSKVIWPADSDASAELSESGSEVGAAPALATTKMEASCY